MREHNDLKWGLSRTLLVTEYSEENNQEVKIIDFLFFSGHTQ